MTEITEDNATEIRVYVGAICQLLADSISDLEDRFAKYGTITSSIELHKKPTLDTYFGYFTIKTTPDKWAALRHAFNKVKFKGSNITIEKALPDYKTRWEQDRAKKDPLPTKDELRRKYGLPRREIDVIPGRMREAPRKKFRYMTFRIMIGKKQKILKCPKKKLWGILKDRKLEELVWQYSKGQWKDGNGDTIETIDFRPISTMKGVSLTAPEDDNEDLEEVEEERNRNLSILESLFANVDEDFIPKASLHKDDEATDKPLYGGQFVQENKKYETYEDDEEEDDEEPWKKSPNFKEAKPIEKEQDISEPQDRDEEMLDVEETKETNETNDSNALSSKPSTKVLRSLFNSEEAGGSFSLFGGQFEEQEDLDNSIIERIEQAETVQKKVINDNSKKVDVVYNDFDASTQRNVIKKGLFFSHFESPFLQSQSQVAMLPQLTDFQKDKWEEHFFSKRSDWAKKYKNRRREALRSIEKKNKARRHTSAF